METKLTITLSVEASKLYNMTNPSQTDIENNSTFFDSNGQTSKPGEIKNFESKVYVDQDVWWEGETKDKENQDKEYSVAILSIVYKAGDDSENFFNTTAICGNGGPNGKVKAKVKKNDYLKGKTNIYSINFSIYPPGDAPMKSYFIDPKLKVNI